MRHTRPENASAGDPSGLHQRKLSVASARSAIVVSGQDTLSLARLGATVTGVDISDTVIDFARDLSHDVGIPATFHRMDICDWFEEAARGTQRFNLVFCSYGMIGWHSDVQACASVAADPDRAP